MPEAENHLLPGATNDSWRTWLMTGVRRTPADRRRMRGAHQGLKRMLVEGMNGGEDRPHAWKDFSGAMIRHAVDDAIRSLPQEDKHVVKLAYFGGYSNREIAVQVGLTEATVQRRLRRALSTISQHIQHGRAVGRSAAYAVMIWLGGRRLEGTMHQFVQAAVVAGAAAIIVAQPAPQAVVSVPHARPIESRATATTPVVSPIPSPSVPGALPKAVNPPPVPTVQLPVQVPPLHLPVQVPPLHLPVHVPPLRA